MTTTILPTTKAVAHTMAHDTAKDDPAIEAAYLFPSNTEIRLVYIDNTARPSPNPQRIVPFYFGADVVGGIPYPSAVALIRREEMKTLQPPEGWGKWESAYLLYGL